MTCDPHVDASYLYERVEEPAIPASVVCPILKTSERDLSIPVDACIARSVVGGMCHKKNCEAGARVRRERGLPVYTYAAPEKPAVEPKPPRKKLTEEEKRERARKKQQIVRMKMKIAALKQELK
jgi:hypothetical protein